jgi:hypothetical protein
MRAIQKIGFMAREAKPWQAASLCVNGINSKGLNAWILYLSPPTP